MPVQQRARVAAILIVVAAGAMAMGPSRADASPRSCTGYDITPADAPRLPKIVAHEPPGTTFCLGPGWYPVIKPISPQPNDRFVGSGSGRGGTRFFGDHNVRGWQAEGGLYVHHGGTVRNYSDHLLCADRTETCMYADDLYVQGRLMHRVLAPCTTDNVLPRTFCIDYAADAIYLHDPPPSGLARYATSENAFHASTGVLITQLSVEHFGNVANGGAAVLLGDESVADDITVAHNHGTGVLMAGHGVLVENSRFTHNGQKGVGGFQTSDLQLLNNEIDNNNIAHYDGNRNAGGAKFTAVDGIVAEGNYFHDNHGNDVSFDGDSIHGTVMNNRFDTARNDAEGGANGVVVEISCFFLVEGNSATGVDRSGFYVLNSHDVTFTGNTASRNVGHDIFVFGSNRLIESSPNCNPGGGIYPITNDVVTSNTIQMIPLSVSGLTASGAVPMDGTRFQLNTYLTSKGGCDQPSWSWYTGRKVSVDFTGFQGFGQESLGSCTEHAGGAHR